MFVSRTFSKVLFSGLAATFIAGQALAGPILLRNEEAPNLCGLEVSVGENAPNGPVQSFGDLEINWEQSFDTNKLCYRVSEPPEMCGTWSDWRCCEAGDGEKLCSIN